MWCDKSTTKQQGQQYLNESYRHRHSAYLIAEIACDNDNTQNSTSIVAE